eukprot:2439721-Rhodomonas_salina.1
MTVLSPALSATPSPPPLAPRRFASSGGVSGVCTSSSSRYALPMPCPLLTYAIARLVLRGVRY